MKFLYLLITLSFTNNICISQQSILDTTKIAIIHFDVKDFYGELDSSNHACSMMQKDIEEVEKIFLQSIHEYDSSLTDLNKKYFVINLKDFNYRRQYVCYKNKKGEKIVYVNCFCAAPEWWRKNLIIVDDGGKCYFSVKINLTTKKWFDFMPGGYA